MTTITLSDSRFITPVGDEGAHRDYVLSIPAIIADRGDAHAGRVVAYLIQRGLDETLRNAWSTQPAATRTHDKVEARLARIIDAPGEVGGTRTDPTTREAMVIARARFAKAGLKSEILKTLNTPEKIKAEIARTAPDRADAIWAALLKQGAEIAAMKAAAVADVDAGDAFADLA